MRLTEEEIAVIKTAIARRFSSVSRILLFGSRVNDNRRGGDIDLFIETDEPLAFAFVHKLEAITDIQFRLGDRKIDLVLGRPSNIADDRPIVRSAREHGIQL